MALAIAKHILQSEGGTTLGSVLQGVRNSSLRKRIYVENAAQGVPLIGGKQLMQWRQMGVKFLSKALTRNLSKETLQEGWTVVSCGGTLGRALYVHRNIDGWAASQHVMRLIPDKSKVFPGFLYAFIASPYGQAQILQRLYGSVISEIRDFQFKTIAVRVPADKGEAIHDTVVQAFDVRADARAAEDQAIGLFEEALRRGRSNVEAEWGAEY
jgi:type I restriction enzyme S subunit